MHHSRVRVLLPLAAAALFAGAAALAVPIATADWALAGAILAAAVGQAEITRRMHPASDAGTALAMAAVWSLAAAVAVHLTTAIAVVLVLYAYRHLRAGEAVAGDAGVLACAVVAAHFAASAGAWATAGPRAGTTGVLLLVAAGVAHLTVNYALTAHGRRALLDRAGDLGLEAALLTIGALAGALATGAPLVLVAAVPVAVTLHNAALSRRLEAAATVDHKTGLATAAYWQASAERVFADAVPDRRPVGLLMVDLDHFKRLNDTYGHRAGDDVLAAVGACLRAELRTTDLGGRFGGEELTVLLPDTDVIDTMTTAERIRAAIAELRVTTVDKQGHHTVVTGVTASIGAATHPHHGMTVDDCLRVADGNVYRAKEQGRNTVVGIDTENLTPLTPRAAEPRSGRSASRS